MVTAVTNTSSLPFTSLPTPSTTNSGSTLHPVNPNRGTSWTRHQAAVSQGARFKGNKLVTTKVVLELLDMLDEVTEELQCKESTEDTSSVKEVHEIAEEFQESP